MRTTLRIDDSVLARVRREAAIEGRTTSQLVEAALRGYLAARRDPEALPSPLPPPARLAEPTARGTHPDAMGGC